MPNITLNIDAQDGNVQAKLAQAEQGVRKLEAAVKVGDRTMKANVTTQEQLAAGMAKFSAAAEKAATAQQRKAAASLAAQKSSALLKQMTDAEREAERKLNEQKRASISLARQKSEALEKQIISEQKLAATQKAMGAGWAQAAQRAMNEAEEANFKRNQKRMAALHQATEGQNAAFKRSAIGAASFATGLLGVGSAAAAAGLAITKLGAEQQRLLDKARQSDEAARGMKEFVALQAPGAEGQAHVKDTMLKAADAGVKAEEAAKMAQPIQSAVDLNADGKLDPEEKKKFDEDYAAALKLRQVGVAPEDVAQVITAGRTKGVGGQESADKLIAASDRSVQGPAAFSRAASSMAQFQDSNTALAVTTALTGEGTSAEQLPTLVRGAALTLGSANDKSDFSKKYGLAGLTEAEKVNKLREIGAAKGKGGTAEERIADFSKSFKNDGLDEEKARAMGLLVRQGGTFNSTLDALNSDAVKGKADTKVGQLKGDALTGSAMQSERAAALAEKNAMYGSEAPVARDKKAEALKKGAWLMREGGDQAVDPTTGEAKSFLSSPWDWYQGRAKAQDKRRQNGEPHAGLSAFMGWDEPSAGAGAGSTSSNASASMDALTKALQENTAATQANSVASKTTAPTGGNPDNSREKY